MVAVDETSSFWEAVREQAKAKGLSEEALRNLRSAQLLRTLAAKTGFNSAATEVAHNLEVLQSYVADNQQAYVHPAQISEAARDRIEGNVGLYVKASSANIERLQGLLRVAESGKISKDEAAHRQGVVLVLSERLGRNTLFFDRLRSLRRDQMAKAESLAARRRVSGTPAQKRGPESAPAAARFQGFDVGLTPSPPSRSRAVERPSSPPANALLQETLQATNRDLVQELTDTFAQVHAAESTVHEIAVLNQMFSTAVVQQNAQVERLYHEAVAATQHIARANVHLGKTLRANASAQRLMACLLLSASLLLLFLDWINS
ncbi:hypothetical protein H632_c1405p0 [Helicosporidium sp. ATCC 50920]|nr:hypothetical protein H632_c1405p0 [Helicosporidium sp. ATCC 50920]|eukprot:KDD74317.1 hypothetical protein H632_c1405p0 [Helicosporidium sp. ATCC 50920]